MNEDSIFDPTRWPSVYEDIARAKDGWDHLATMFAEMEQEAEQETEQ